MLGLHWDIVDPLAYYSRPGMMTNAREYGSMLEGIPDDLGSICKIVQGNLVHVFWAERMGLTLTSNQQLSLQARPVVEKLALMSQTNSQPIIVPRPLQQRQVGNCRDFSVLFCAILRHKGIPARTRCGFGAYFVPDHYEDHWVCEYWNTKTRRWVMVDSQLDLLQRDALHISFDPLDVPPEGFIIAGRAWKMCRTGKSDPDKFGIMDMHGLRFVWGNVVRDFLSLNKIEILPWDGGWGFLNQKLSDPLPDKETLELYDRIAAMTVNVNKDFRKVLAYYKSEPQLHLPSDWDMSEE